MNDLYIIFYYYGCKFSKYLTVSLKAQSLSQAMNILVLFLDKVSILYSFSRHTCQTLNPKCVSPSFFPIKTVTLGEKKKKVVGSDGNSVTGVTLFHVAEMLKAPLPHRHTEY